MTDQNKMPDEISLFRCESEGDIKWSEDSSDALATYVNEYLYTAVVAERDALRELCDGMELALRDLAAYVGCWTFSTDKGRQEVSFLPTDPRGLLCNRAKQALALLQQKGGDQ